MRQMPDLYDRILELVYPALCPVCGKRLPYGRGMQIHPSCLALLQPVRGEVCPRCGKPVSSGTGALCRDCQAQEKSFVSGRSLWVYDRWSSRTVFLYKYGRKRELAEFFASALEDGCGDWIRQISPDLIVPVPVSRERYRQRGFNQAELVAQILAGRTGIPCGTGVLKRIRKTQPQKGLSPALRRSNLSHAFQARPGACRDGQKILLLDDIYTTGATAQACTLALQARADVRVWVLTLCIGEQSF